MHWVSLYVIFVSGSSACQNRFSDAFSCSNEAVMELNPSFHSIQFRPRLHCTGTAVLVCYKVVTVPQHFQVDERH